MRFKTFFLFLSFLLWLSSSYISGWIFPTNTEQDINGYWELKKILYSVCILLIILSAEYNNKFKKLLALIFIGFLGEDVSDRLQGITYFEYSDILIVELVIISSVYVLYKEDLKNMYKECFRH